MRNPIHIILVLGCMFLAACATGYLLVIAKVDVYSRETVTGVGILFWIFLSAVFAQWALSETEAE